MHTVVPAPKTPSLPVAGSEARFPVRRVYCVGRNYAAHAREMGKDPEREPPFFFMKPADAVVLAEHRVPYPPMTRDLHHEVELVVALGKAGTEVAEAEALSLVYGYAVGVDLTRRDLQAEAKKLSRPWDTAKGFDHAAPCGTVQPAERVGHPDAGRIWLEVDGDLRQSGDLAEMIWPVPALIAELSRYFELRPGDLIMTGTPAGVGALERGQRVSGGVEGVDEFGFEIV